MRMNEDKIQVRLISTWCNKRRPCGRPNMSLRQSILSNVSKIVPSVDRDSTFNSWDHIAQYKLIWSILLNTLSYD